MCYIFLISVKLIVDLCTYIYVCMIFPREPTVKHLPGHQQSGSNKRVTAVCPSGVRRPKLSLMISPVDRKKQMKIGQ